MDQNVNKPFTSIEKSSAQQILEILREELFVFRYKSKTEEVLLDRAYMRYCEKTNDIANASKLITFTAFLDFVTFVRRVLLSSNTSLEFIIYSNAPGELLLNTTEADRAAVATNSQQVPSDPFEITIELAKFINSRISYRTLRGASYPRNCSREKMDRHFIAFLSIDNNSTRERLENSLFPI